MSYMDLRVESMMNFEEDTYSLIFSALKHPSRRKIMRILADGPNTYTDIQNKLEVETGFLNYYLESLDGLIMKNKDGKYCISGLGRSAIGLIRHVEDFVPENKTDYKITVLGFKVKVIYIMLLVIFILTIPNVYWIYAFQREGNEKTNLMGVSILNANMLLNESEEIINTTIVEGRLSFHSWFYLLDYTTKISNQFKTIKNLDADHYNQWSQFELATDKLSNFISDVLEKHGRDYPYKNVKDWTFMLTILREDLLTIDKVLPSIVILGTDPRIEIIDDFSNEALIAGFKLQQDIDLARRSLSIPETLLN